MKLSLDELKTYVASVVTTTKLSNSTFVETRDNVVGLLDKIGAIITLDTDFTQDKLAEFDGMYLSFGKTIEEWYQDLIMPTAYDPDGAGALSPADPTYRPVFYSYSVGKQKIKETIRNNNIERAVHFTEQFISIVAMEYKRLEDSMSQYRYGVKREILSKFLQLCVDNTDFVTLNEFNHSSNYTEGTPLRTGTTSTGIVVKAYTANASASWADAVAKGYIIEYDLIEYLAKPTDSTTGEDFLVKVKEDVEVASDVSEGHSLNGNTIGAVKGLVLIVRQGIMPNLDVKTMAGAFHLDKVAVPVRVIVVKDFGSYVEDGDSNEVKPFAVLMDNRAFRLHNTYNAVRENFNGDGDFLNLFRHTEDTAYISRNAFVKWYCEPIA